MADLDLAVVPYEAFDDHAYEPHPEAQPEHPVAAVAESVVAAPAAIATAEAPPAAVSAVAGHLSAHEVELLARLEQMDALPILPPELGTAVIFGPRGSAAAQTAAQIAGTAELKPPADLLPALDIGIAADEPAAAEAEPAAMAEAPAETAPEAMAEAAEALGLSRYRIFRRIILPQAMPAIVPASGNLLIGLLKATSIVSVIAVQDLLYSAQLIYQQNYLILPLLLVATIWYIIVTSVLSVGQYFVERHYSRGNRRPQQSFWTTVRENLPLFGRVRTELRRLDLRNEGAVRA